MLPSRCPHCQAELPERGRFCVMCGRRVEGWAGLVPAAPVPRELPSEHDRTRPSAPSPNLLRSATQEVDEELLRPTREIPSIGHELRALSPDHRVHTSPVGTILPTGVMNALGVALSSLPSSRAAAAGAVPAPAMDAGARRPASRSDGVPVAPLPDEPTDHVRLERRSPVTETLHLSLLAMLCATIAVLVGLFAYRLMTRAVDGGALVLSEQGGDPSPEPEARPASRQGAARARQPLPRGVHRTRDLVVSVAPSSRLPVERRGRGPVRPATLPPIGPTSSTTLDGAAPASLPEALPPPVAEAPLSEEERRAEAEAQLAGADIEFVASTHNIQVRQCHERAFKDGGSPGGKVELSFTLNQEGRAVNVGTVVNTTGSDLLARCLEGRVAEWRFPRPVGGAKQYQFPFVFLAAAGGGR